jgi:hypothetical protein
MRHLVSRAAVIAAILGLTLGLFPPPANAVVIGFDSLSDLESVTTQFSGLTFANTTALTAGISLNELDFPPRSGTNVVFDDGGAITIAFSAAQTDVGGYFTYVAPLTLTAFDADGGLLGSVASAFASNFVSAGDPGSHPNELLSFASILGIRSVRIEGAADGGSFTLDDLTFNAAPAATPVPEPSTLSLVSVVLTAGFGVWLRSRRVATGK